MVAPPRPRFLRYGESEIDPAVQAEILLESARSEARLSILVIVLAFGFTVWYGITSDISRAVDLFAVLAVLPLLVDSYIRRTTARRLRGHGPQPPPRTPPTH